MAAIAKSGGSVKKVITGRQQCIPEQVVEPAARFAPGEFPLRGRRIWPPSTPIWLASGISQKTAHSPRSRCSPGVTEWCGEFAKKAMSGGHRSNPAWSAVAVRCAPTGKYTLRKTILPPSTLSLPSSGTQQKMGALPRSRFHRAPRVRCGGDVKRGMSGKPPWHPEPLVVMAALSALGKR